MRLRRYFVLVGVLAALNLAACTAEYTAQLAAKTLQDVHLKSDYKVDRQSDWVIHSSTAIFLAWPAQFEEETRARHLATLFAAMRLGLEQSFPAFHSAPGTLHLQEAFALARQHESDLVFWPKLVAVDNRLNSPQELIEGQGLHPDQKYGTDSTVFQVLVYDVKTQRLLDVATIFSRSRFFADNDSQAMNLLDRAVKHYVFTITGKKVG